MIGGLQGDFRDLDIKYLKQNISKCRSHISGSFRRTPRHCAKWLRNSPGRRYRRIRIFLTKEVETPSFPIQICLSDVKYPEKVESHPNRISDVGYPSGMSAKKNSGCENFRPGGKKRAIRSNSIRIPQAGTRRLRTSHTRTIAYPIRICCLNHCPILLAFQICLWQRTSKLRFFMFLIFPFALPWIPKNSTQSWITLVIKKLSKHQNLTQFD